MIGTEYVLNIFPGTIFLDFGDLGYFNIWDLTLKRRWVVHKHNAGQPWQKYKHLNEFSVVRSKYRLDTEDYEKDCQIKSFCLLYH